MEKANTPHTSSSAEKQQQPQHQNNSAVHRTSTSAAASALVISACDKAGMEGIDRERIDAIILRESEKTMYMQQQRRRDQKVNERIAAMQEKLQQQNNNTCNSNMSASSVGQTKDSNKNNKHWQRQIEKELEPEVDDILTARRHRSTACVVDMDCFYWACELLSRPHLRDLPCCVGESMITTSNYPARKFGVRSGMAGWIADKLVEELSNGQQKLIHVPNHFELYQEKSKLAKAVFRQFDPNCRSYSLDEAYLNLAPYLALKLSNTSIDKTTTCWSHEQISQHLASIMVGDDKEENQAKEDFDATLQMYSSRDCLAAASETVFLMRRKVCEATGGLTCSAGLGSSFQIAKIASDINKPDGQKIVGAALEEDVWPFLRPLSTRKVPGIGRVSQKILEAFGISTVQQLYDERALVRFLFGPATAKFLLRASLGGFGSSSHDQCPEEGPDGEKSTSTLKRKGISKERTFSHGDPWPKIYTRLEDIARGLSRQMEEEGIFARTISLKVKLHTFDVIQRSKTVATGTALQKGGDLLSHAVEMLQELRKEHKGNQFSPRLIGIRCSNLMDAKEVSVLAANQGDMAKFLSGPSSSANASSSFRGRRDRSRSPEPSKRGAVMSFFSTKDDEQKAPTTTLPSKQTFKPTEPIELDLTATKSQEQQTATCPICNHAITAASDDALNRALNDHIDSCLNAPAIRQAVREETKRCDTRPQPAKKQRLTEFFSK